MTWSKLQIDHKLYKGEYASKTFHYLVIYLVILNNAECKLFIRESSNESLGSCRMFRYRHDSLAFRVLLTSDSVKNNPVLYLDPASLPFIEDIWGLQSILMLKNANVT